MKIYRLHYKSVLLSFITCVLLFCSAFSQKNWELIRSKDSIYIYKREMAGSSLKELKVVSHFESNLTGFVSFIKDVPAQPLYMYSCINSKIIKKVSEKELIFYQQVKAPWPFTDRDGIYHQVIEQDSATRTITIHSTSMNNFLPKNKNFVRVPVMKSSWIIKPRADGTINAEYYFYGEPGGSLPAWLINMFIAEAPYKTQKKMRELIKQKKYQEAKPGDIIN